MVHALDLTINGLSIRITWNENNISTTTTKMKMMKFSHDWNKEHWRIKKNKEKIRFYSKCWTLNGVLLLILLERMQKQSIAYILWYLQNLFSFTSCFLITLMITKSSARYFMEIIFSHSTKLFPTEILNTEKFMWEPKKIYFETKLFIFIEKKNEQK